MNAPKNRKARHKVPPSQTMAGPSNDDRKDKLSHQPNKLNYAEKPLKGKKFYLELTGQRHKSQHVKLKAELEALGASVEQFLSKDLACVISDRAEAKDTERGSKGMPSGTSPAVSTPSPFHQLRDGTPGAAESPSNVAEDAQVVTRGKAIVQKAAKSQMYGTTDVLTNARNWNIPIKHLDVVMKYLSREREKLKQIGQGKKKTTKERHADKAKGRQLTKPYLKAEDITRRFRPITKEFSAWPRVLMDTRSGSCPYDPKTRNESHLQGAERTQDRPDASPRTPEVRHKEQPSRSQSLSRKVISKAAKQREMTAAKKLVAKKGFCEFCTVKYTHLEKHLQSEQHKLLVAKKNNYLNLDSMIAEGPNLDRFLEDCVRFQGADSAPSTSRPREVEEPDIQDEVNLLTEEGSTSMKTQPCPIVISHAISSSSCKQNAETQPKMVSGAKNAKRMGEEERVGESRSAELQKRLGGGDVSVIDALRTVGLGSPDSPTSRPKLGSPEGSKVRRGKCKKRSGGGRTSLSPQPREWGDVPSRGPEESHGSARVAVGDGMGEIHRGIAGDEEPIPRDDCCGDEVIIMRIRRTDTGVDGTALESDRTKTVDASAATKQPGGDTNHLGNSQCKVSGSAGLALVCETSASHSQEDLEQVHRLRTKRGSHAISSPDSCKRSQKGKKQKMCEEDVENDDVFVDGPELGIWQNALVKATPHVVEDRHQERPKRKSRRSHGEAPPHKIRGSSTAVDSTGITNDSIGVGKTTSPCVREPQPRAPPPLHDSHSSDDFQQINLTTFLTVKTLRRHGKPSGKAQGTESSVQDASAAAKSVRAFARNTTNVIQATEITNSEEDFQMTSLSLSQSKQRGDRIPCSNKSNKSKKYARKKGKCQGDHVAQETVHSTTSDIEDVSQGSRSNKKDVQNRECEYPNGSAGHIQNAQNIEDGGENHTMPQDHSLEFVFRSDLGVEESSFLGFSQEEINETINNSKSIQKGQLSQKLEAAALNVYCVPSSDPHPDDDDNSSAGNLGDITIGLVLQKVDNFSSEGSEWEEQVTGFMQKLDTQLEIKRRRESELSTLPSPSFTRTTFDAQKENQGYLQSLVEGFEPKLMSNNEDLDDIPVFVDSTANKNASERKTFIRRRSARINSSSELKRVTRSMPTSQVSYSGMCVSPSKKRRNIMSPKQTKVSQSKSVDRHGSKQALRELSSNQIPISPRQDKDSPKFSTPKQTRRNLWHDHVSPNSRLQHIVFPPGTPVAEQEEILDNYVHDDSESEVVFPKFSSPPQKGCIFSPVKHCVKRKMCRHRYPSVPCLGQRDVQSSPIRPSNMHVPLPFGVPSSRKSLFMRGRLKCINVSSPRKLAKHSPTKHRRSSLSSPGKKHPHILTFLNEIRAGLSPTFYTFKKPHFSLHILQPSAARHHRCRTQMSRSLLALNLCLPSNADLRIYEFHDDESMEDPDDLVISPITSDTTRTEMHDQYTQTPPSHKRRRGRPRRLHGGWRRSSLSPASSGAVRGKTGSPEKVELVQEEMGHRSVKVQASSPDINSILDLPLEYFL